MGVQRFEHTFSRERTATLIVALLQILLIVTAIGLAVLSWKEYRWIILLVAALSLALFLFFSFYLVYQFSSLPAYRKKLQIEDKAKEIYRVNQELLTTINRAVESRDAIEENERASISNRQVEHTQTLNNISKRRSEIIAAAKQAHADELSRIQEEYLAQGLWQTTIHEATIQGVGGKMKDRLAQARILTAADVTIAKVSAVPGFGEAKTMAVVDWRRSVERRLDSNKPSKLPQEIGSGLKNNQETACNSF
jgi:DNA-binding helix-hairpin-helix protein with protein kinase domain